MTFNPGAVFNPEGAAVFGCAIGFIIFLGWLDARRERREWLKRKAEFQRRQREFWEPRRD